MTYKIEEQVRSKSQSQSFITNQSSFSVNKDEKQQEIFSLADLLRQGWQGRRFFKIAGSKNIDGQDKEMKKTMA